MFLLDTKNTKNTKMVQHQQQLAVLTVDSNSKLEIMVWLYVPFLRLHEHNCRVAYHPVELGA